MDEQDVVIKHIRKTMADRAAARLAPSGRDPATIEAAALIAERAGCGDPKCMGCFGNQIASSIRALAAPAVVTEE